MSNFFNPDNPVNQLLSKAADYMILSLLWFVFALPLVTAPAATTALYYTYVKVFREESGTIWSCFWKAFRSNFIYATLLGVPLLLICAFWGTTLVNLAKAGQFRSVVFWMALILLACSLSWLHYALSYLARFADSIPRTLRNTFMMCIVHFPCSVALFLLFAAVVLAIWTMLPLLPLVLVFLPSLYAWAASFFLEKVYQRYMK